MSSRSLFAIPVLVLTTGALLVLARKRSETPPAVRSASGEPSAQDAVKAAGAPGVGPTQPIRDAALEPYRSGLLDVAFNAATAIPSMPHIKTRSRGQERVVGACFELDQPRLALGYIEEIDNWRRGAGYADVAFYLAEHGRGSDVQRYLDLANGYVQRMNFLDDEVAGEIDDGSIEGFQAWRRDRIRAKIARTLLLLGETAKAAEFAEGLEPSEIGAVELVAARTMDSSAVEAHAEVLAAVAGEADFDRVRNALGVGVRLLGRFHADAKMRALLEAKLDACLAKSPVFLRIEFLLALADESLERGDRARAVARLEEIEGVQGENLFAPEDGIPLAARIAVLRQRAGEEDAARVELAAARARFQAKRAEIANLQRAEVLVPIAEAYRALGDTAAALEVYRQAVEDGAENPNGVPRAEDLCNTLCSMAVSGVEPDAALWSRIRAIHAGLREPW